MLNIYDLHNYDFFAIFFQLKKIRKIRKILKMKKSENSNSRSMLGSNQGESGSRKYGLRSDSSPTSNNTVHVYCLYM